MALFWVKALRDENECYFPEVQYSNCAPRAILAVLFSLLFRHDGGRSPTPSASKAGRKINNVARGAHIAYCTEEKTRVFQQSVMKSFQKTKNGGEMAQRACCFSPPSGKKQNNARYFFLQILRVFSLSGGKIVGKPGTRERK